MYRRYFLSGVLFIYMIFSFSLGQLYAQEEEGEIIIISERVGKEIDQAEREKFKLFEEVKGFQSAVYIKLPDNRYFLKITYQDEKTGETKIKRIQQSEVSIKNSGDFIDRYEEIQAQTHQDLKIDTQGKPGRFSIGEQWLFGPKFGASPYTGFLGLEIQKKKWSLSTGLTHMAACFGLKYYFSDLNKAWYLGTFWAKGFKNSDTDMDFGFGSGHRWLYNNGFNWGVGVFIVFPKDKEKSSDSPPGISPELYLGYSF